MRKKLMSIALCLTMVVGALAGCGNAGKDAATGREQKRKAG